MRWGFREEPIPQVCCCCRRIGANRDCNKGKTPRKSSFLVLITAFAQRLAKKRKALSARQENKDAEAKSCALENRRRNKTNKQFCGNAVMNSCAGDAGNKTSMFCCWLIILRIKPKLFCCVWHGDPVSMGLLR